jgi:hypothetical protein
VAAALNVRPRDSRLASGYSLVDVHAWSRSVADVDRCIQRLDPRIRVVTPDIFVRLLDRNVGPPPILIDRGSAQLASYDAPTSPAMTLTPNRPDPSVDGTPSTRVRVGADYAFVNLRFPAPLHLNCGRTQLEFDLHSDGSGSAIRFELWSDACAAFLYLDLRLDDVGWRHIAHRLDGSDGLRAWNASPQQVASALSIWQVSGSWNGIPGMFHIDNVRLVAAPSRHTRPALSWTRSGPDLRLSWPADFAQFQPQSAAAVRGPWQPIDTPAVCADCVCSIPATPAAGAAFFRLATP